MDSPTRPQEAERWLRPGLLWFAFDLLAPTALIYGLLGLGASLYAALLGSAALSAGSALVAYRRGTGNRSFALPMLGLSLAGFGIALVSGSDRFLLAKESVITAMVGFWFLGSLWSARPLTYVLTRPLLEGRVPGKRRPWEALWAAEPRFRRIWRVSTAMWAAATLIDAILRVVLAYALPVRVVPAMQTGMFIATMLLMQVLTNGYYVRAGLWHMLREESGARAQPPS